MLVASFDATATSDAIVIEEIRKLQQERHFRIPMATSSSNSHSAVEIESPPTSVGAAEASVPSLNEFQPLVLPDWQIDEFNKRIRRWEVALDETTEPEDRERWTPAIVNCFSRNAEAALHFDLFARLIVRWSGKPVPEPFDALAYLRDEEPRIVAKLKSSMMSTETTFIKGEFKSRSCEMDFTNVKSALYGDSGTLESNHSTPNSVVNHMAALQRCLKDDHDSRYRQILDASCKTLFLMMTQTSIGLESLLKQHAGIQTYISREPMEVGGDEEASKQGKVSM